MANQTMREKQFNIMTSSDQKLLPYIPIQLYSIANSLKDSIIDFYLFHRGLETAVLNPLDTFCRRLGNICFHAIAVPEPEKYDALAKYGNHWVGEAYFSLCAHQLLPEDTDRILYIDAGDVLIVNDISPYYFCDFEDKALIVTAARYKTQNNTLAAFEEKDLYHIANGFPAICRGLFNSGSYVINLRKLREAHLELDDYLLFSNQLLELSGKDGSSPIYFGDQGFLSAAFVGDLKLYDYPRIKNLWYMPYNFCLWYYDRIKEQPPYPPAIVHFAGCKKPWNMQYLISLQNFPAPEKPCSLQELKIGQAEWYYLWHEYAILADRILSE